MKWRQLCGLVGVSVFWGGSPLTASAGWLTLTAGKAGVAAPTATSEFWYAVPHGELLTVEQIKNAGTVQATTGGGTTYFGGLGIPVVLDLSDGSGNLSGGNPPAGIATRGPGGEPAGSLASSAPQNGVPIPADSARLGLEFTDAGPDGVRTMSVTVSDGSGHVLGTGTLAVPEDGWWVLGLGPGRQPETDPDPIPTPDPDPIPTPVPENPSGVPEPGAVALGVSGLATLLLRRKRSRES